MPVSGCVSVVSSVLLLRLAENIVVLPLNDLSENPRPALIGGLTSAKHQVTIRESIVLKSSRIKNPGISSRTWPPRSGTADSRTMAKRMGWPFAISSQCLRYQSRWTRSAPVFGASPSPIELSSCMPFTYCYIARLLQSKILSLGSENVAQLLKIGSPE
jgi:hypothetical protein